MLVGERRERKTVAGVGVVGVVCMGVILGLVVTVLVLGGTKRGGVWGPTRRSPVPEGERYTVSDYVLGVLAPHRPSFQWVPNPTPSSPVLTKVVGSEVVAVDRKGQASVVVPSTLSLPPPVGGRDGGRVVHRTLGGRGSR